VVRFVDGQQRTICPVQFTLSLGGTVVSGLISIVYISIVYYSVYIFVYIYVYICMYLCIYMYTYMYVCMCIYVCV
jgi:hypothetical protein